MEVVSLLLKYNPNLVYILFWLLPVDILFYLIVYLLCVLLFTLVTSPLINKQHNLKQLVFVER